MSTASANKSVLDVAVSHVPNYMTPGDTTHIQLLKWLTDTQLKDAVLAIRAEPDKSKRSKLKAQLPAITPSGIFRHASKAGLIKHNGLIQFDIDGQDNRHVGNMDTLGNQLKNIVHVAYCGLSVSGRGWWGLIPITNPEEHEAHFDALEIDFKRFGITIDRACRNVKTLRGYSYDPEAYFNHNAAPYSKTYYKPPPPPPARRAPKDYNPGNEGSNDLEAIATRVSIPEVVHYLSGCNSEKELANGLKMACPCPDTRAGSTRFSVWPDKGTYYCHKCGMGEGIGGPFKLVQAAQDISFVEAKNFLVETFAPELANGSPSPTPQKKIMPDGWKRDPDGNLLDNDGLKVVDWWGADDLARASKLEYEAIMRERRRLKL